MGITDELREWAKDNTLQDRVLTTYPPQHAVHGVLETLLRIADRIDAEHQKALDEWKAKHGQMWLKGYAECHAELLEGNETLASDLESCGWIRLPKDADGVPIHIGDVLTDDAEFKSEGNVERLMFDESGWMVGFGKGWTDVSIHEWHHYHAPTVEDVLREFGDWYAHTKGGCDEDGIIAEFAAKLRLAGDAE